jgi:hypothetical protein
MQSAFRLAKPDHDEWQEFPLNGKTIKLKTQAQHKATTFSYKPVANDSPVLRTVSRRWPHRASIDVWTSDNEAYNVKGLENLRVVLLALRAGKTLPNAIAAAIAQRRVDTTGARSLARFVKTILGK